MACLLGFAGRRQVHRKVGPFGVANNMRCKGEDGGDTGGARALMTGAGVERRIKDFVFNFHSLETHCPVGAMHN